MFFPRSTPLTLTRDAIRELRLSLNTPVVATEELPIGPARAAILVHEDAEVGPEVTIGIRSLRAGRVALYAFEGDLRDPSNFGVAVDAALSFAESMGFLFDEDELGASGASGRVRCLGLWRDLLGEDALGGASAPRAEEPEADELLLEELAADAPPGRLTDAPGFLKGDDARAPGAGDFGGATDVFVPQFEGDLGAPGDGLAFDPAGALAFDTESAGARVAFDAEPGRDDEASFAGILDPTDESPAPHASAGSDEADASEEWVAEPPPSARPLPAPAASLVSLTKFRTGLAAPTAPTGSEAPAAPEQAAPAAANPAAAAPSRATALGKLRLIRRMRGGGGRKRHSILRLFGSF